MACHERDRAGGLRGGREADTDRTVALEPGFPWHCVGRAARCGVAGPCCAAFSLTLERQPVAGDTWAPCERVSEDGLTGSTGRLLDLQESLKTQRANSAEEEAYQLLEPVQTQAPGSRASGPHLCIPKAPCGPWDPVDTHQ